MENNRLEVRWNGQQVGILSLSPGGVCVFEYTPEFIAHGVSISPFELPLKKELFVASYLPFEGGFGVFDDSLPDGWGLLILDRYLRQKGIEPRSISLLQRLALVGRNGRGALEFYPDESSFSPSEKSHLNRLASEASQILKSEKFNGKGIEDLYKRGGSPGGARPKVFIKDEGKEWMVKFPATQDSPDIGKIEYDYSLLAKSCGVEMAETRLFEGKYFGVERFDRRGDTKIHTVSIAGLLRADYRLPSIDYSHIFKAVGILTRNNSELIKVYRLMAFNYLIGNNDDHAKNFSMQFEGGKWIFAPAYDLLPGGGINGYRTTSINGSITPTPEDVIAAGVSAGLPNCLCKDIYSDMEEKILKRNSRSLIK